MSQNETEQTKSCKNQNKALKIKNEANKLDLLYTTKEGTLQKKTMQNKPNSSWNIAYGTCTGLAKY